MLMFLFFISLFLLLFLYSLPFALPISSLPEVSGDLEAQHLNVDSFVISRDELSDQEKATANSCFPSVELGFSNLENRSLFYSCIAFEQKVCFFYFSL